MKAIILSVGDELVLGQTVDTNSAWLSRELAGVGWRVAAHVTVPDDQPAIELALREAVGRCDVLIVTGGIGPTADDLTRQALAAVMNVPLEEDPRWVEALKGFFEKRGRIMPASNRIQAMIPRGAGMIHNPAGTAAGIHSRVQGSGFSVQPPDLSPEPGTANSLDIYILPGVPKEMQLMFSEYVLPRMRQGGGDGCILSRTLHTFGMGESWIAEKLGDLMTRGRNPSVGTTVSHGIVSVRVNARFDSRGQAEQELERAVEQCRACLGDLIFGADEQTLEQVVGRMLADTRRTVATAESCTGGLLAKMFTDVHGSSEWFLQGWVTYSNEAKMRELEVPAPLIDNYGAVSEEVAGQLAENAREKSGADFALSITGVAGPTGGTRAKPVGTVCLALAAFDQTHVRTFNFTGDREIIRDRSARMALAMLRFHLLDKPLPF
jgi:nicotinamide-nucleotide amidase